MYDNFENSLACITCICWVHVLAVELTGSHDCNDFSVYYLIINVFKRSRIFIAKLTIMKGFS